MEMMNNHLHFYHLIIRYKMRGIFKEMEDSKNICSTAIKAKAIEFKSVNDIIDVKITDDDGPELILEDDSIVVFTNHATYFDLLIKGGIKDNMINISVLDLLFKHEHDDAPEVYYDNKQIIEVTKYTCNNNDNIYRFFIY